MSKLNDLADTIGSHYKRRAHLQINLAHLDEDERGRKAWLVANCNLEQLTMPVKTVDDRKRAFEFIFGRDDILKSIAEKQSSLRDELTELQAELDAAEMQFKAERWNIRLALAKALRGGIVEEGGRDGDFDSATDNAIDEQIELANAPAQDEPGLMPEEEIPF